MKKVAILTINDDSNYGNRLQNYASQELLKKHQVSVETIRNEIGIYGILKYKKKVKELIKLSLPLKKFKKFRNFHSFNRLIKTSRFYIDKNHISPKINKKYDIFFTGSDQVWNYNFNRMSDIDFLTFVEESKRNSLSASFGIRSIDENLKEKYSKLLSKFNAISVREDSGKTIVNELTGRKDIEVLLDPTMLLDIEDWIKIEKKPKHLNENKYILLYFLGKISKEREEFINKITKENNYQIVNIFDKNGKFSDIGPREWLYLENNASLICTDSFHSCVFSILFKRDFIVFDREDKNKSMNSRIDTLLSKFNLENRRFNQLDFLNLFNTDYSNTQEVLKKEREKANNYLKKILE